MAVAVDACKGQIVELIGTTMLFGNYVVNLERREVQPGSQVAILATAGGALPHSPYSVGGIHVWFA